MDNVPQNDPRQNGGITPAVLIGGILASVGIPTVLLAHGTLGLVVGAVLNVVGAVLVFFGDRLSRARTARDTVDQ
jgi:hypothetical protein